ncbi:MAG: 16S rRNA (adenine(1518)-N(6)/adenine(1519)-N(6))-dimethyltransferase RsmA, partial [Candidatus Babeliales bacterium]
MARTKKIPFKKKFGQHFLRDHRIVQYIVDTVDLDSTSSVFEIGCGDGFLTRAILEKPLARLWVFEIDPTWAQFVKNNIQDQRLEVFEENFLDVDFTMFKNNVPWTLLANLPYQITFPILHRLQEHRQLLKEGVIMVQEEVAQKIIKTHGRGYGFVSLFFQWFFSWQLLEKIPPSAFTPPPKVFSRLLYFKPYRELKPIPDEKQFWRFVKVAFKQPRRTLRNNLQQSHYDLTKIPEATLLLRAQQ